MNNNVLNWFRNSFHNDYDVVDENGNQKWDKYNDAINAAYSFLKKIKSKLF